MAENTPSTSSRTREPLQPQDAAKSMYLREIENACNMKPLLNEMEKLMATSESENDFDSDEAIPMPSTSAGTSAVNPAKKFKKKHKKRGENRQVNGVMTTKEERKKAKLRHFNFSANDPERQWLRDVLLTSTESSSEDDTPEGKDRRIKEMLRERRLYLKYQKKFNKDNPKHQRMYYSTGFLSTIDRYPEYRAQRAAPIPRPKTRRGRSAAEKSRADESEQGKVALERGRIGAERRRAASERGKARSEAEQAAKAASVVMPARARPAKRRMIMEEAPPKPIAEPLAVSIDMSDALTLEWEEHLHSMTLPPLTDTEDDYMTPLGTGPDSRPGTSHSMTRSRSSKKVEPSSTETMAVKRKRHWQMIAKKEVPKLHRSRQAAHKEALIQKKKLANMCSKHIRTTAMQSQKNTKETPWRCKRLNREMQNYWRRYDRAERETKKRKEKEAEEQRKMDVELIEVKRQRRKLNFLITQTELYAHFMQRKALSDGDSRAEFILHQLDEEVDPKLASVDSYDSAEMKAKAARNAREAFRAERARTQLFDAQTGVTPEEEVDVEGEGETKRGGDFDQPSTFAGELKGYQLKGMNWLASLYDQGISGILADEMGLGKTVQCIAFLCHIAERLGVWGPFLIVSPTSTLHNWQQEMERFAPEFKVVPYWGGPPERKILRQFWSRKDLHTRTALFHVVITSYQIVVSDLKYLNRVSWQYMILDEAQAIKSAQSMRWKILLGFSCRNRLLLSGTPIQNSMAELWALLHFIMPTLFDSHEEFNEWFSKDIESHAENKSTIDEKHLSRLHMILKPFMLRRIKKDVENELSDKIEILLHCPLTIRQKLLYIALKKKIKIEELLQYSGAGSIESGHNVDKNFTSNLMNLVMQFRKVCNHPELFERRDLRSPFYMQIDDYHVPKLIAEDGLLLGAIPSRRHLLYNKLCILTPSYINESLKGVENDMDGEDAGVVQSDGLFAFTRLMNLSPMEIYRVALCGWLCAMHHIEQSMEKNELVRHRINWWFKMYEIKGKSKKAKPSTYYDRAMLKDMLLVCPDGNTLNQKKGDGVVWTDLLFTDPYWVQGGPFFSHEDHILHYMPETIEHRAMRHKHYQAKSGERLVVKNEVGEILSIRPEEPKEFPHVERSPVVRTMCPTPLLKSLITVQPKVGVATRAPFAVSRSFAHHVTRHRHAEYAVGASLLASLVARARPPFGWDSLQVPDKNQLVSDAGKLTVLDSLLKRLKENNHRVLIYSQMTKMIDLLEEYMYYRKHKFMRLDGSSKISARRDMVADFQARTDIFVFLLSTRAGGLGINLTAADTVIFYDSDWNPTVDQQAMDRAHRLGQTKQVTVYRLICKGTIEERIMQRAREKSEIQRMVISGGNFKPDTLKPKEVVSLLLDDKEIELKYRQKSEEKRREERERKKNIVLPPSVTQPSCSNISRINYPLLTTAIPAPKPWGPNSPLLEDDDSSSSALVVDIPPPSSPIPEFTGAVRGAQRGARRSRRGRPRGSRNVGCRRPDLGLAPSSPYPANNAGAVAAGAALLASGAPLEVLGVVPATELGRGRRGPGRPRTRPAAPRPNNRRPRRAREPLLVPLAPPP